MSPEKKPGEKGVDADKIIGAAREEGAPDFWLSVAVRGIVRVPMNIARGVGRVFTYFILQDRKSGKTFRGGVPASEEELERYKEAKGRQGKKKQ